MSEKRAAWGQALQFARDAAGYRGQECLEWPFSKDRKGYGTLKANGKGYSANRYVCELAHGKPPTPRHEAAHSCGKGHEGCVNPNHLEWKTHKDNCADKVLHGTLLRGEQHPDAKLTESQARQIIALRGVKSQTKIAAEFGVTQSNVSRIHSGDTWACLYSASPNNP